MIDANTYLTTLANKLKIHPNTKDKIDTSISHLKGKIWELFQDKLLKVVVFGSYDRETYIEEDDESDVDILVIFKTKELQPQTYLNQIAAFGKKIYSRSDVFPDYPTIAIEMDHVKFEVVPSHYLRETIMIPAPNSKQLKWINTFPNEFKRKLQDKDANNKELVLPIIRLIKYWNVINGKIFSSFDIEKLVLNKTFTCKTLRDYYFYATNSLEQIAITGQQKESFKDLKERNRRLRALEQMKIPEYIETEFSAFLPLPK